MAQEDKQRIRRVKNVDAVKPGTFRGAIKPTKTSEGETGANTQANAPHAVAPKPTAASTATPTQDVSLEKLISSFMKTAPSDSMDDVLWGASVSRKEEAAHKHFRIPASDKVRLILDTTIFGSCKVGFALCDKGGVYLHDEQGRRGSISWKDLKTCKFTCDNSLFLIDDLRFLTQSGRQLCKLMEQLQGKLS